MSVREREQALAETVKRLTADVASRDAQIEKLERSLIMLVIPSFL